MPPTAATMWTDSLPEHHPIIANRCVPLHDRDRHGGNDKGRGYSPAFVRRKAADTSQVHSVC